MRNYTFLLLIIMIALIARNTSAQNFDIKINEELQITTQKLINSFDQISQERKAKLIEIGDFIFSELEEKKTFNALFVCTHNSRRSHIADLWFKYGSLYYGIDGLVSFSGGLEETAFNPNAIAALQRSGFTVIYNKRVKNAVVSITPGNYPVWRMQSKLFDHPVNPKKDFVAVMVCSDADQSCPSVPGADGRFALPYDDPRYFDGKPSQNQKYDETVALIGREILFLTQHIINQMNSKQESTK